MQVCPNCGYIDHPYWRHKPWRHNIDYCRLDEFAEIRPELAQKLKNGSPVVVDESFAYRRCGSRKFYVERVWVQLYNSGGQSAFRTYKEKHRHEDPLQKKLNGE